MQYQQLTDRLRGVAFTTPTPFDGDGSEILHDELRENTQYVLDAGGRVIVPCGNTGEYYSLSNDERVAVVRTTAETVGGEGVVVGGAGGSTKNAKRLIERYERAGADAAMIMTPSHTYLHDRGILDYYRALVESTDLGIVLYKRGDELTLDHLKRLTAYENVVAVKYAVNDVKAFSKAVETIDEDVVWFNGIAERFAPSFALEGAEGLTTGIGNFLPEETLSLMDALENRDWERALSIRDALRPYEDLREEPGTDGTIAAGNNVPAVKYGMELVGRYGGPVREPLVDLSAADRERAEEFYRAIRDERIAPTADD